MRYDAASDYYTPDCVSGSPDSYIARSEVIEVALRFSTGRRTVVQAGGHIGVWPRKLADLFSRVVCFEPVPSNWECLVKNANQPNVTLYNEALGPKDGTVEINHRTRSTGGHHVATRLDRPHITTQVRALDSLALADVDALFLDIEGFEIEALKGAARILEEQKPLLVIENNGCSGKYGYPREALRRFLRTYGYRYVDRFDEDEIFV